MPVAQVVFADLKQSIRSCTPEQLSELNTFCVNLIKQRRKSNNFVAIASLQIGDKVVTSSNVRPARFANRKAVIVSVRQTKVVINFTDESNPIPITCPASSLTLVK